MYENDRSVLSLVLLFLCYMFVLFVKILVNVKNMLEMNRILGNIFLGELRNTFGIIILVSRRLYITKKFDETWRSRS